MDKQSKISTLYSSDDRFDNLNELPIHIIEHMLELNDETPALHYLEPLVTRENQRYLRGFIRSVVINKESHETWNKGKVLLLSRPYEDLFTIERLELFNRANSRFENIVRLSYEDWSFYSFETGGFAFYLPNANYKFTAPENYIMVSPSEFELERIEEHKTDLHFRRWLASFMANQMRYQNKLQLDGVSILDDIADRKRWTPDALKALDGLLLEMKDGISEGAVPGFSGPDNYYQ